MTSTKLGRVGRWLTTHVLASTLSVIGLCGITRDAQAQQQLIGAGGDVGSGIEGGGWQSKFAVRRARTTLRVGMDFRVDETPKHMYGGALLVEIEPKTTFGAEAFYGYLASKSFVLNVGAVGIVTPNTLVGPMAGVTYRYFLTEELAFTLSPTMIVYVVGNDLPGNRPIWQALLRAGFHVDL